MGQSYTATWPQKIHLSPVREGAIKPRVFLHWMNQNNGVLCKFVAQQRPDTPPNNKMLVNQLINYLAEKSIVSLFQGLWLGWNANRLKSMLWPAGHSPTGPECEK